MTSFFELFKRSVFDDLTAYTENPTILVYLYIQEGLMKSTRLQSNDNTEINQRL